MQRRQDRAQRFGTQGQGLSYGKVASPEAQQSAQERRSRAQRFGLDIQAPKEPTGQARAGKCWVLHHANSIEVCY